MTDESTSGKAGPTEPTDGAEAATPTGDEAEAPAGTTDDDPGSGQGAPSAGGADDDTADDSVVDDAHASSDAGPVDEGAATVAGADGARDEVEVDPDLQAAADAVEVDLELLLSERAQYLDAYRRAQADFENYRKQAQRRQDDAVVRSLGNFVESLLPVLDSCDAALAHGATEVEPVLSALYGALTKEGLERIDPKGAAFDPTEAEAVMHEPGEGGEQVVAEVLRPGYRWRGQVLRPAMVKVTD